MEVKPGYKQTEVGVIPEDWEVRQIGDIEPFVTSGSRGWAAFYSEHGSPFIRITNLSRTCIYLDLEDLRFVNIPANDSEGSRTQLRDGDVLISITAEIGIVGHVTAKLTTPAYINQHIALVRFDSTRINPRFVSYFLASEKPQKLFRALTDSGAKAGMNLTTVQQIRIALPPTKAEQEAIAEALSDADALIESLEQLLAKKRQLKQGAMQELLTGKRRLPGFEVKPGYRQTEVGMIPEDWGVAVLDSLGKRGRPAIKAGPFGSSLRKDTYVAEGYKVYGQEQVIRGDHLYGDYYISKAKFNDLRSCSVEAGDILLSLVGTAGRVLMIPPGAPEGIINPRLIRFSFDRGVLSPLFFQFLFETAAYQTLLARSAQGGTMGVLNAGLLRPIPVPLPLLAEQEAIATILSEMDAEIAALEAKLAKARQLKQGMMQELLTGRIRLV